MSGVARSVDVGASNTGVFWDVAQSLRMDSGTVILILTRFLRHKYLPHESRVRGSLVPGPRVLKDLFNH